VEWSFDLSQDMPPRTETSQELRARIAKIPGIIVHRRIGPPQPWVPDPLLRVREGLTVKEILGYDDEDDE
jgi:hypothetical protein